MSDKSSIECTNATWNPVTDCTKITRGCDHCYAERLRGIRGHSYEHGFDLTLRPDRLSRPLAWKKPRRVFVNSMSDLFHKRIPLAFIDRVFDTMEAADRHVFQVLTRCSTGLRRYIRRRYGTDRVAPHIRCGVSVEDEIATARIRHLQQTPISTMILSIERLLGPLPQLDLEGIGWVIVGDESGPRARPMRREWILDIGSVPARGRPILFQRESYTILAARF